jgi:hypothetical protein
VPEVPDATTDPSKPPVHQEAFDRILLAEVPYAAANLQIPPGGQSDMLEQDQQLQIAEQLLEPGAHTKLAYA